MRAFPLLTTAAVLAGAVARPSFSYERDLARQRHQVHSDLPAQTLVAGQKDISPAVSARGGGFRNSLAGNENAFFVTHGILTLLLGGSLLLSVNTFFRLTALLNRAIGQDFSATTASAAAGADPTIYRCMGAASLSFGIMDLLSAQSVDRGFRRSRITSDVAFTSVGVAALLYEWVAKGNSQYASLMVALGFFCAWANYLRSNPDYSGGPRARFT